MRARKFKSITLTLAHIIITGYVMCARAHSYEEFVKAASPEEIEQLNDRLNRTPDPTSEQIERLAGYNRKLNILMYAGPWCGDCSR